MAGKKQAAQVTVDGIAVEVDLAYIRSWDGIRMAAHMQDAGRDDAERLADMIAYYEGAVSNIDDVSEQMRGRAAEDVVALLGRAVQEATPKN